MKTKFMINGSNVSIIKLNEETALDYLPPKVYTLQFDKFMGFYLNITKDLLQVPKRIYGTTDDRVEKCVKSYISRDKSTGILLTGDKGTGKTLLMALLSNAVIDNLKLPVVLIKEPFNGEQFTSFIESIGECCLVFDEFGKMYSNNKHNNDAVQQDSLLSLMDGVDKTKRMIILSENNILDINEFMLNRPSRIYYHFRYTKLDEVSVTGYCNDHSVSDDVTKDIIELSRRSKIFSFDMLQSIVEEHIRFNQSIDDVVKDLNIDTSQETAVNMRIIKVMLKDTKEVVELVGSPIVQKPTYHYTYIEVKAKSEPKLGLAPPVSLGIVDDDNDDDNINELSLAPNSLVYEAAGNLIYETNRYTIMAEEMPPMMANYRNMF